MDRGQIERFVKKVVPDIPVNIKYYTHKSERANLALTYYDNSEIYLNLVYLRQKKYRANENLLILRVIVSFFIFYFRFSDFVV